MTMSQSASPQEENMAAIGQDDIHPVIVKFFSRLPVDKWESLNKSKSDDGIKIYVAEFILDLNNNFIISEEVVWSILGNTLPQTIADFLDIKDTVECASATSLTRLLVKEAVTVKSAVSCNSQAEGFMESNTSLPTTDLMSWLVTPSIRKEKRAMETSTDGQKGDDVNDEKSHSHQAPIRPQIQGLPSQKPQRSTIPSFKPQLSPLSNLRDRGPSLPSQKPQLLPSFKPQRQGLPTQKPQRSTIPSFKSQGPVYPLKNLSCSPYQTSETGSAHSQTSETKSALSNRSGSVPRFPKTSASSGLRTASSGLEVSIGSDTSRMVEDIITKEFFKITEPLMDSMTKSESDLLRADTVEEIAELTQFIVKESNSKTTIEEVEAEIKLGEKNICGKIKAFLTRRVAKLTIHRMLSGLKKTFCPGARASCLNSMRAFDNDIDDLLTEEGDGDHDCNEVCVYQRMKDISLGKNHVFEMLLKELLYTHTTREMTIPEFTPGVTERLVAPPPEALKSAIRRQVCRFLGVFGWFVNNEAVTQTKRMISAFEEIEAPPTITEEAPVSVSSKAKMEVKVLVQKLVTRLFKNAKVNHDIGNAVGVVESLLEKVWAKVEGQSFTVTPDTFQTLDKVVYKDLVRIWGCAESVVVTFNMEGSSEENCVASIFKARLMSQPKKRGAVCKFLRSVGKAISKPFRRSSEPVWVL
ncbi:hypothetical protein F7725_027299 [Dissostichus mawsoni]|uniref:Uncharacterized protein n=1 Tax=Dissostichus mawsoni TaxID=36200 RepID=A0A7J5XCR7_DISMA|nr:hypothetical protein F7725_027299 [Dissostichus mawsoni]